MFAERLENWGRWLRSGMGGSGGHCVSIEHRYRSPQCWYPPEPRMVIDVRDAWKVQDAMTSAVNARFMDANESRALLYAYGWKDTHRWRAAKRCGCSTPRQLEDRSIIALNRLKSWITRQDESFYHHSNNLILASA